MEQHPIPQQISSYQFKLVGDMTLGQFGKAAGGILLAVLVNTWKSTGIATLLIKYPLMAILGGGGLAMAFVPFEDRPLETWLLAFIKSIYAPTIFVWKKAIPANWLDVDRNKVLTKEEDELIEVPKKDEGKIREFIQSLPSFKRESKGSLVGGEEKTDVQSELEKVANSMTEEQKELIDKDKTKKEVKKEENKAVDKEDDGSMGNLDLKREKLKATGVAEFGGIPMPVTPTEPNVLSGMVIGPNNEIIEEAIVEVRDKSDNPVRVFKTNALGQFRTATPLLSGNYLVVTEKTGFVFDRVNVAMEGKILEPIKIRAKEKKEAVKS